MRFDLHVHSAYSPDSTIRLEELVKLVKQSWLDGFALTDHNSVAGIHKARGICKRNGVVFVPGVEVSSKDGHILGYFVDEPISSGLPGVETVELIHDQGGLAVCAHPYDFLRSGMGEKAVRRLKLDGIEVANSKTIWGNGAALRLADELGLAKTGGSDAHTLKEVGGAWTECIGLRKDILANKTVAGGGFTLASLESRVVRFFKGKSGLKV